MWSELTVHIVLHGAFVRKLFHVIGIEKCVLALFNATTETNTRMAHTYNQQVRQIYHLPLVYFILLRQAENDIHTGTKARFRVYDA